MTASLVYLDNNATTPVDPEVLNAMLPWFSERFGNAASITHQMGLDASDAVEGARQQIADSLNVGLREVIFTSGATESNNLAIKGTMRSAGRGTHLIVSSAEHKAVLDPANRLRREGFDVTVLPVDTHGCVSPESVRQALRPTTALVSVMLANNEVGSLNPITDIGEICREAGVLLHCDAAQALGKIDVKPADLNVDLMSLSAHKVYGPKGIGALYVRETEPALRIEPLQHGGGHENSLRSGTLPVPLIVAFGAATQIATDNLDTESKTLHDLRQQCWNQLNSQLDGLTLNGHPENRIPGNLNFSVPDVDGDVLMSNIVGVAISNGSACTTADPEPSHVLLAMGRSARTARASLRLGFGRFNTAADVSVAVSSIVAAVRASQ